MHKVFDGVAGIDTPDVGNIGAGRVYSKRMPLTGQDGGARVQIALWLYGSMALLAL